VLGLRHASAAARLTAPLPFPDRAIVNGGPRLLVTRPSDATGERPIGDALLIDAAGSAFIPVARQR
jgi:hypothetical protein